MQLSEALNNSGSFYLPMGTSNGAPLSVPQATIFFCTCVLINVILSWPLCNYNVANDWIFKFCGWCWKRVSQAISPCHIASCQKSIPSLSQTTLYHVARCSPALACWDSIVLVWSFNVKASQLAKKEQKRVTMTQVKMSWCGVDLAKIPHLTVDFVQNALRMNGMCGVEFSKNPHHTDTFSLHAEN